MSAKLSRHTLAKFGLGRRNKPGHAESSRIAHLKRKERRWLASHSG